MNAFVANSPLVLSFPASTMTTRIRPRSSGTLGSGMHSASRTHRVFPTRDGPTSTISSPFMIAKLAAASRRHVAS